MDKIFTDPRIQKKIKNHIRKCISKLKCWNLKLWRQQKGLINGIGWITSIGLYDILRQKSVENYPTAINSATDANNQAGQKSSGSTQATTPNLTFEDAMKIGIALYLDYAIPIESISTEAYVVPYIGAYLLGPSNKISSDATKIYLKTGLSLEKLIRFTTISLGWDSNNIIELANKNTNNAALGSAFLQFKIAYSGS